MRHDREIQRGLIWYFLKLGATGFGGPVALANYMLRDLVENRKWITQEEYSEGLTLAQLAPGPMATQLAIYIGWARGGNLGATLCGLAFVIPSFFMCIALAYAYIQFGELPWLKYLFYTIGAAVIGIIINSAYKLMKKNVGSDRTLLAIWIISALVTAISETEYLILFLIAGLITVVARNKGTSLRTTFPAWFLTGLGGAVSLGTIGDIAWYFTKAGTFVFGSGLAIVPFLHAGVVHEFKWLNEAQFLDAVAVAMITPGPVVITVAFIGFLVAGFAGAVVAALGTFLPCYLLTIFPAPHFSRIAKNKKIKDFVDGVTAAAVGAIAGACYVLGKGAIKDIPTGLVAIVTLLVITRTKISEPVVILVSGLIGILLFAMKLI